MVWQRDEETVWLFTNFAGAADVSTDVNRLKSALLLAALVFAACTGEVASEVDTTRQTPTSIPGDASTSTGELTASTSVLGDLRATTIDLLDGSELEVAGPAQLELGGYSYFIVIPGLGESNVYLIPNVDPVEPAAVQDTVFHSDLGDGVKLWVGDREGRPLFMTVEMGEWVTLVHIGWDAPPETDFLLSLAAQMRGEAPNRGVVISDFDVDVFATSLHDPDSEDSVDLWVGQCLRERIPGSEAIEHPDRGGLIRKSGYASWCEPENDLEVTVSGAERFVDWVVETLTLTRSSSVGEVSGWRRIPHDEAVFGGSGDQFVMAVAAGPSSFVAVGSEFSVGEPRAISWVSSDGRSWSRNDEVALEAGMEDVAWFDAGDLFVAVGHQVSDGAIWTSPDGSSWTRAALIPFSNPAGGIEIESVTDTGLGLVAAGMEWYGEGASIPAVWTSTDGHTWSRAELDLSGINEATENGLVDVVGHEDDLFAAGFSWSGNVTKEPKLWASIDGATWRPIDLDEEDVIESTLNAIAVGDDGTLVMVGESKAEHVDSRAWLSEDLGQTWSRVEVESGNVGIADLKDVIHNNSGWVAVGSDGTTRHERGELIAAVWHKEDTRGWTRISPRDQQFRPQESAGIARMTAVTSIGGVIVAGGFDGTDCSTTVVAPMEFMRCDLDAALWIWNPNH